MRVESEMGPWNRDEGYMAISQGKLGATRGERTER